MTKFFRCNVCGFYAVQIDGHNGPMTCCGASLQELKAGVTDASKEKHIPKVVQNGNIVTVEVGSVMHPQTEEHFIGFVYLQTQNGGQLVKLSKDKPPVASFALVDGDKAIAAYEWCNLHGLWKLDI